MHQKTAYLYIYLSIEQQAQPIHLIMDGEGLFKHGRCHLVEEMPLIHQN